jgi:hypothetical protein
LYVGGNSENIPKFSVFPAALAPSTVNLRTLPVFDADVDGVKLKVNFFHDEVTPDNVVVAKTWPEAEETRAAVTEPVYELDLT